MKGIRFVLLYVGSADLRQPLEQPVSDSIGERGIVDVQIQLDKLHRWLHMPT